MKRLRPLTSAVGGKMSSATGDRQIPQQPSDLLKFREKEMPSLHHVIKFD